MDFTIGRNSSLTYRPNRRPLGRQLCLPISPTSRKIPSSELQPPPDPSATPDKVAGATPVAGEARNVPAGGSFQSLPE